MIVAFAGVFPGQLQPIEDVHAEVMGGQRTYHRVNAEVEVCLLGRKADDADGVGEGLGVDVGEGFGDRLSSEVRFTSRRRARMGAVSLHDLPEATYVVTAIIGCEMAVVDQVRDGKPACALLLAYEAG